MCLRAWVVGACVCVHRAGRTMPGWDMSGRSVRIGDGCRALLWVDVWGQNTDSGTWGALAALPDGRQVWRVVANRPCRRRRCLSHPRRRRASQAQARKAKKHGREVAIDNRHTFLRSLRSLISQTSP
jgi:hypothetical protein